MKCFITFVMLAISSSAFATEPPSTLALHFFQGITSTTILECTDPCPMDFDNNGSVNADDLVEFISHYSTEPENGCEGGDFDEDGFVTVNDLRMQVAIWGYQCQ